MANLTRGTVGEFLHDNIVNGSRLSIVSAYFTIYAYAALRHELEQIGELRFLFGEPRFVKSLDPRKSDSKAFEIIDDGLQLTNQLEQKQIARQCADWIREKVEIRSVRRANLLHGIVVPH